MISSMEDGCEKKILQDSELDNHLEVEICSFCLFLS